MHCQNTTHILECVFPMYIIAVYIYGIYIIFFEINNNNNLLYLIYITTTHNTQQNIDIDTHIHKL